MLLEALDIGGVPVGGVANIGQRPTVNGVRQQLEVHFFDFKAIYNCSKQLEYDFYTNCAAR